MVILNFYTSKGCALSAPQLCALTIKTQYDQTPYFVFAIFIPDVVMRRKGSEHIPKTGADRKGYVWGFGNIRLKGSTIAVTVLSCDYETRERSMR